MASQRGGRTTPTPKPVAVVTAPVAALQLRGSLKVAIEPLFLAKVESLEKLRAEVDAYVASVRSRSTKLEFVDTSTAESIARGLFGLITSVDPADENQIRLVQAAARYFILEEDEDGDLSSPTGFDDDAEVFNAVALALGHEELIVVLE